MTFQDALAKAKGAVEKIFLSKWGKIKWYCLSPSEKHNYAVCWAAGYLAAEEELAKKDGSES